MENISEWNEQVSFAEIYFGLTAKGKIAQQNGNIIDWKRWVDAKYCMARTILSKKDSTDEEQLIENRKNLNDTFNKCTRSSSNIDKGILYEATLEFEVFLDKIVNKKMPFLKLPRDDDIKGM